MPYRFFVKPEILFSAFIGKFYVSPVMSEFDLFCWIQT